MQAPVGVAHHVQRLQVEEGYRIDVLVEEELILELEAVEEVTELHKAQLLTYLRLNKCWLGLLLNFNVPTMRDGIVRLVCLCGYSGHLKDFT